MYLQACKCKDVVCVCTCKHANVRQEWCVCVCVPACERRMGESAFAVKFFALLYVYIHCSGNARMGKALLFTDLLEFLLGLLRPCATLENSVRFTCVA